MKLYDVIVLGGGAAGLMCAMTAGARGKRVLVLECSNKVGKKILMSGGGRCNFTNLHIDPSRYISANSHFCKSALKQYTQWDFIQLVEKHGIAYHEKEEGQLFCDQSSKQIVQLLLDECTATSVDIETHCEVLTVSQGNKNYKIVSSLGCYTSNALVIATGGLSIPKMGGSGFGYQLAEQFSLKLEPRVAGLVPLTFTDHYQKMFAELSGISSYAAVRAGRQTFINDILFTHRGLSGPAILQVSSYWQPGSDIFIDLLPERDLSEYLLNIKKNKPSMKLIQVLNMFWPKKCLICFWNIFVLISIWHNQCTKSVIKSVGKLLN